MHVSQSALLLLLATLPALSLLLRPRRRLCAPRLDVIVKLGGSAITHKASFETLNAAALAATSKMVASSKCRAVLMHGAGSFGHFQARQYAVSKGSADPSFSWAGFGLTRRSVCKLNGHVVGALLEEGVAAVHVPSFPTLTTRGKGVVAPRTLDTGVRQVCSLLDAGLLPVLHGDAVLDELQGSSILSGDTLMVLLSHALRPRLAVFLTDVPGVYDRPPSEKGATLLTRIGVGPDGQLRIAAATSTAAHDVTGGLATKLAAAAQIAKCGTPVVIVQVGTAQAEACFRGEIPDVCTLIVAE